MTRTARIGVAAISLLAALTWATGITMAHTARTAPGTLKRSILGQGIVEPLGGTAEIRPRIDGRVLRVLVDEGDPVEAGALLAELTQEGAEVEAHRLGAEKLALQAAARGLLAGAEPNERRGLAAELDVSRAESELANRELARIEQLAASGSISDMRLNERRIAARIARARWRAQEARLEHARAPASLADRNVASARIEAATAALAGADVQIQRSRLLSPIRGMVLARRIDVGDTLVEATTATSPAAFEVADPSVLRLRIELEASDAQSIALDRSVSVMLGAKEVGRGRVTRLGVRLQPRTIGPNDARQRADDLVRAAWADVVWNPPAPPALGQRFDVRVLLPRHREPVVVSRRAVHVEDGRVFVCVPGLFGARHVDVAVLAADDLSVALSGIAAGRLVELQ